MQVNQHFTTTTNTRQHCSLRFASSFDRLNSTKTHGGKHDAAPGKEPRASINCRLSYRANLRPAGWASSPKLVGAPLLPASWERTSRAGSSQGLPLCLSLQVRLRARLEQQHVTLRDASRWSRHRGVTLPVRPERPPSWPAVVQGQVG